MLIDHRLLGYYVFTTHTGLLTNSKMCPDTRSSFIWSNIHTCELISVTSWGRSIHIHTYMRGWGHTQPLFWPQMLYFPAKNKINLF